MRLYRAVSELEWNDYQRDNIFRTTTRTLEAKQFFKKEESVKDFVRRAIDQNYDPPYLYLITIEVTNALQNPQIIKTQILDGFEAVTIDEDDLTLFSQFTNFINCDAL